MKCEFCKKNEATSFVVEYGVFLCEECFCLDEIDNEVD